MFDPLHTRRSYSRWRGLTVLAAAVAVIAGCSSKDDDSAPGTTAPVSTFVGVMINVNENGRLAVSISSGTLGPPPGALATQATLVLAGATFYPVGGSPVALVGEYDADSDSLSLSGGGYAFSTMVEADNDPPSFIAEYTGPNGPGFAGALQTSAGFSPQVFCGTLMSDSTGGGGNLSFIASDSLFAGIAVPELGLEPFSFDGTVSGTGTTRTVMATDDGGTVQVAISGTYNTLTGASSGTWMTNDTMSGDMDAGSWTAGPCP